MREFEEHNEQQMDSEVEKSESILLGVTETNSYTVAQPQSNEGKQLPPNVEYVKGRRWLPYVITAVVLAVVTILLGWARGGFADAELNVLIGNWSDAFSIPGVLCLGVGLLIVGSNGGAFDMLAYGVRRFFGLFRKDPIDRKYNTFYDYAQARRGNKRSFWYLIVVGGAYLLVGVILLVIYMQM